MSTKSKLSMLAAAALSLMAATQASATMITSVTNPLNFSSVAAGSVILPGMTTPAFFNAAGQRFIATFSSECAVSGLVGWTDVDVVVLNGFGAVVATLPPTVGAADAFCAPNTTAGFDGWETNAVTAVYAGVPALAAGFYRVQVRARRDGGATGLWFGERSLVVSR